MKINKDPQSRKGVFFCFVAICALMVVATGLHLSGSSYFENAGVPYEHVFFVGMAVGAFVLILTFLSHKD